MTLIQSLSRLMSGVSTTPGMTRRLSANFMPVRALEPDPLSAIIQYRVLRALYDENGLYEDLQFILNAFGLWKEALQPLRNPANRVAEFYAGNLWPGADLEVALPIEGCSEAVADSILQTWKWSNWASKKQVFARYLAIYGDGFIKVIGSMNPPRVFFQLLEAETATALFTDERGYITHIRLDIPIYKLQNFQKVPITLTEIWDKETDSMTTWEHQQGPGADQSQLGDPLERVSISETYGIDFIPIVQGKFKDVGDTRGQGAYAHCFDKITEVNRMSTRLHQLLFRHNNVTFALRANGVDANMRPLPAPQVDGVTQENAGKDVMIIGDDRFITLGGNQEMVPLIPDLHYAEHLAVVNAQMDEIKQDLPELAYYQLRELGGQGLSGRAIRLLLNDAIDRALEARGNAEAALVRADMMAITIGQAIGAFPTSIGTYEQGALDHVFKQREMIRTSDLEDAQESLAEAQAGVLWEQLGVSRQEILRQRGYTDREIEEMQQETLENAALQASIFGAPNGQSAGQAAASGETGTPFAGEGVGPRNPPLQGGAAGGGGTITGQQP